VELRRNGRRVSVTGLNRIHRHTSTRDTEFYGEQARETHKNRTESEAVNLLSPARRGLSRVLEGHIR